MEEIIAGVLGVGFGLAFHCLAFRRRGTKPTWMQRRILKMMLVNAPWTATELASAFNRFPDMSVADAKGHLERLVDLGLVETKNSPSSYVLSEVGRWWAVWGGRR